MLGAVVTRLALLASVFWLAKLTDPLWVLFDEEVSVRDLVLICGGLFLLAKSTLEIHGSMEVGGHDTSHAPKAISFSSVLAQIVVLDIVFSLDSSLPPSAWPTCSG